MGHRPRIHRIQNAPALKARITSAVISFRSLAPLIWTCNIFGTENYRGTEAALSALDLRNDRIPGAMPQVRHGESVLWRTNMRRALGAKRISSPSVLERRLTYERFSMSDAASRLFL
jgi:hypothetical protein